MKISARGFGYVRSPSYIYPVNDEIIKVMITEKVKASLFREVYREQFKQEFFKDYNAIAYERSATGLAKRENNDCVVKAFMCALDCNYETAHKFIGDKMKRENRKGTYTYLFAKNVINTTKNGKRITFIGAHPSKSYMQTNVAGSKNKKVLANPKYKKPTGFTLKSFIENHPVGRFVLIVEGHAVACINGVLHGNSNEKHQGLYRSVWYGFEMK